MDYLTALCLLFSVSGKCSTLVRDTMSRPVAENTFDSYPCIVSTLSDLNPQNPLFCLPAKYVGHGQLIAEFYFFY